jgi:hypothetical protein
MAEAVIFTVAALFVLHLLGGARAHRRHYRQHGLHPNLYYTYGRGFYGSVKIGGFRIGHHL